MGNAEAVTRILEYVDRTKVGALGAVGLVTLVLTAVTVLGNIELSLNDIWQVQKGRSFIRKVADYMASWCIVLFGAELAFIHQLPGRGRHLRVRHHLWVPRVDVALALLTGIARQFETRQPPPRGHDLIAELGLDPAEAVRIFGRLADAGLIAETNDEPPGLLPARSPDRTSVAELVDAIYQLSGPDGMSERFAARLREILEGELGGSTWADLALEEER